MIRVQIPSQLQMLAGTAEEVEVEPGGDTLGAVLDSLERTHPPLRGTIRDISTGKRRALIRFFMCEQDFSHQSMDTPLPEAVLLGREPLIIVGAIAGG